MKAIENTFRAIFAQDAPNLISFGATSSIHENGADATFTDLTWTNAEFLTFNPAIAEDMSGFFTKHSARQVFLKNCDGVMMFEEDGRRYLYLSEMKSSFKFDDIAEAKSQLLSTYLKLNMLLNLASGYHNEDITVKGFIISHGPDAEKKADLRKYRQLPEKKRKKAHYNFCLKLLEKGKKGWHIRPSESYNLAPCRLGERGIFPELELHYVEVPAGQTSLTLDARKYL